MIVLTLSLCIICVLLFAFSSKMIKHPKYLKLFRAACLLVIAVLILNHFIFNTDVGISKKLLGVVMIIFAGYWATQIVQFLIRRQYGHTKEISGETVYLESYNSRLLSLLVAILVFIFALIGIVQLLGFTELLQAGGIIGVIGVMLALTQSSWAPDIISGLIILNSSFLNEGDVIQIDSENLTARVYRTRLFHTELLNIVNNNRVLISNYKLRQAYIQNLSKFASARGYRQSLTFKIGYDTPPSDVKALFQAAYASVADDTAIAIETGHELEIRVDNTGDHAIEWCVYYYTKDMKSVIKTRQLFTEVILEHALQSGIDLSTPILMDNAPISTTTAVT